MTVVGDPEGMRALADRLAKDADQLRHCKSRVKKAWKKVDASGDWADTCEVVIDANADGLDSAADSLAALVKTLRRSADEVEEQIAAEKRRLEAAERARREAAAKAASAE